MILSYLIIPIYVWRSATGACWLTNAHDTNNAWWHIICDRSIPFACLQSSSWPEPLAAQVGPCANDERYPTYPAATTFTWRRAKPPTAWNINAALVVASATVIFTCQRQRIVDSESHNKNLSIPATFFAICSDFTVNSWRHWISSVWCLRCLPYQWSTPTWTANAHFDTNAQVRTHTTYLKEHLLQCLATFCNTIILKRAFSPVWQPANSKKMTLGEVLLWLIIKMWLIPAQLHSIIYPQIFGKPKCFRLPSNTVKLPDS